MCCCVSQLHNFHSFFWAAQKLARPRDNRWSRASSPHLSTCSSSWGWRSLRLLTRGTTDCLALERWRDGGSLEDTMSSISSTTESQADGMIWGNDHTSPHVITIITITRQHDHNLIRRWPVPLFIYFHLYFNKKTSKLHKITRSVYFTVSFWDSFDSIFLFNLFINVQIH